MSYTYIERQWTYKNHQCAVTFLAHGHRCGYVLPNSQIFNLVSISMLSVALENITPHTYLIAPLQLRFNELSVHGGVTFFNRHPSLPAGRHVGFDCNHYGDAPDLETLKQYESAGLLKARSTSTIYPGIVRSLDFCVVQCEHLVDQLISISQDFDHLLTDIPEAFL